MTAPLSLRVNFSLILAMVLISCNGQNKSTTVGTNTNIDSISPEYFGIPLDFTSSDTSAGWNQNGQKIRLTGIVYQLDGKTPAPGVVIYYYQTNIEGKYIHKQSEKTSLPPNSKGQTHGYIRGWVKTDPNGRYSIYTVRPGPYPGGNEPAHIHLTVKEPGLKNFYYIDDAVFDDDRLLTSEKRKKMENRGGSGILRMVKSDGLQIGERNIILGLNIPDHLSTKSPATNSGKEIGEDIMSFIPYHAWGPDKGTRTCPVCKYGWYHGILYFVGNDPDWEEIKQWLVYLDNESIKREKYLKAYFIYGNETGYDKVKREKELENIGRELQLKKIALTYVPSFSDADSEINLNRINAGVKNTFILYRRSVVIDKFINLKPEQTNFNLLSQRLDQTINEFFDLPGITDLK